MTDREFRGLGPPDADPIWVDGMDLASNYDWVHGYGDVIGETVVAENEPWEEITDATVAGGKLTLSGLSLSGYAVVRLLVTGVTVTTDDSEIRLTFIVAGTEVTAGYNWALSRTSPGVGAQSAAAGATYISLTAAVATQKVGNAAGKSFSAIITVHAPTGTQNKKAFHRSIWTRTGGEPEGGTYAVGELPNAGAITGFVVAGESDLVSGTVTLLGVE
jgi:hypothetical protein